MASFTDIIPQFTPYIQQLPVEAMVKVGMQKQQQYDEGIQKIQTQIDNIAGLDIIRDVDKAYLQSKLNELGNNLKGVAAGDFSNFQLVNSVSGMTSQLVKDKNIQNAISSTQQIRKQQAAMEDDRKTGKLHKNNETFFNDQLENYLTNTEPGKVFSDNYQPYTDYQKKWREIQKDLGVKETQTDIPFLMDASGKYYVDEKGNKLAEGAKPIPNDYMIREKFKGVDPKRLKEAIMISLDDNDYRQMQIDAHVQYKGYTPDLLLKDAQKTYLSNREDLAKTVENLSILKNQNINNQQMTEKIDEQLNAYLSRINEEDEQFKETIASVRSNPEGYKSKLFTMNTINGFANSFSNMSHIQEIVDSPIKKQMNEDRNYNFKVIEFNTKNEQWKKTFGLSERSQLLAESKADFDRKLELYKLGLGPSPLGPGAGKYVGAPPTDSEVLDGMYESFKQGANLAQLEDDKNNIKVNWARNQPSKADFEKQLNKKLTDTEYKTLLDKQFNSDLTAYNSNRNSVDASTRKLLDQYSSLDKLYKLKANVIDQTTQEINDVFKPLEKKIIDKMNAEKGFDKFSAYDVYNIDRKVSKYINYGSTVSGGYGYGYSSGTTFDDAGARRDLTPEEFSIYQRYKSKYFGSPDQTIQGFQNRAQQLVKKYKDDFEAILSNKDKAFAVNLKNKINSIAPVEASLPKGASSTLLPIILGKFEREQKGETEQATGFVKGSDFDIETTKLLSLDPNSKTTYTTFGNDVYITMIGSVKNKAVTQKFKLSKGEFSDQFPNLIDNADVDFLQSAAANGSTNYKYHIAKSAINNKEDAFASAQYTIPSSKYIIKSDIFFDQNDKNSTLPVIYVKSKKTGNVVTISSDEFLTFTGSEQSINQINDLFIENHFKNKNLNANF